MRFLRMWLFLVLASLGTGSLGTGSLGNAQVPESDSVPAPLLGPDMPLRAADRLYQTGHYEEAAEAFQQCANDFPTESAIGLAACLQAQGESTKSLATLQAAVETALARAPVAATVDDQIARLHAEAALVCLTMGDTAEADSMIEQSLDRDRDSVSAHYARAELLRAAGKTTEARRDYQWLATDQRVANVTGMEGILVGRAVSRLASWKGDVAQFDLLVNQHYPRLLRHDPRLWQAHCEAARLFLEKYNLPEALRELSAAATINPHAAEIHVLLGQVALQDLDLDRASAAAARAIASNPRCAAAWQLQGDIACRHLWADDALTPLERCREINPSDAGTLGRLFAIFLRCDGLRSTDNPTSRASRLLESTRRIERDGAEFLLAAAQTFDALRLYPAAEQYYRKAIVASPDWTTPQNDLGLVQMRLGMERDARATLEAAFAHDPFHVRVKNTLAVLDVLDTYAVLETDHFVIKFDRGHDQLLAEAAARFLEEEVFSQTVTQLGFTPPEKCLLEIFSRRNGVNGHGWFSARMVGLPFVGTVGACAGKMFAIVSPADGQPYNWARVLRHEFVHMVNLQQTEFLIPHWFTEALAVRNEQVGYPIEWDRILAKYVAANELFDLATINHGFVRPVNNERWSLAYFQAYLYADYAQQLGGPDTLARMLDGYGRGHSTQQVLQLVLGKSLDEFETGYRSYLTDRMQTRGMTADQFVKSRSLIEEANRASRDGKWTEAKHLFQQGQRDFPHDLAWSKGLARVLLVQNQEGELATTLAKIAEREVDELALARKLTQLAAKRKDAVELQRWATRVLHIDVADAQAHADLANAFAQQSRWADAVRELTIATQLAPVQTEWSRLLDQWQRR